MDRESALLDSKALAMIIIREFNPQSIIELGCGSGRLLYPYYEQGIEVMGVDASQNAKSVSKLPDNRFEIADLKEKYQPSKTYDIVMCVEVLEHIPAYASDIVVESISRCAPIAIVTAAPPGQGGTHHVNEQPKSYWINKFSDCGMRYKPEKSSEIGQSLSLSELTWIPNNLMIFEALRN
ncbi:2-polyprenyl-3-methyl-5-hydroxy-6-metoxy-1,4-benzoquinol methylase [Salinibacter ruber]|uniref:class I SAM-dependent methyltransferase n=1 Tax=Salinibacter ruber TaxID=146919 RepID=UPI00216A6968|nr:class I SAM-dependent methyltransferase [Salinibacter ruber]MCS4161422.1 2-polyprenyl-3-methyl-5-hydroxy-6-metoxy-1,4-benzoquinol methylase [Salinibacter ruber]